MSKRYSVFLPAIIYIADLLILNLSIFSAHYHFPSENKIPVGGLIFILLINLSWSTVALLSKSFKISRPQRLRANLNKFITTLIYHLLLVFAVIQFLGITIIARYEIVSAYCIFSVVALSFRLALLNALDIYRKKGYNARRIVILGEEDTCNRISASFKNHPEYGYKIVKTINITELERFSDATLQNYLLNCDLNEIYLCYKQLSQKFIDNMIAFSDTNQIKVQLVPDFSINNKYTQIIDYDGIQVIQISSSPHDDHKIIFIKRIFDISFSLFVMIIGMPVFLMLFIITKLSSKGNVFYKQERIGKNGKPFFIFKFRSMHLDSEKLLPQLSSDNDPRITKWGKVMRQSRLDELPQFWNVLKGEMSIVGPRPERQYFIEKIMEIKPDYRRLLNIKPGITSIGQVSYGYAENIEQICDRVNYDLPYLQNMTFNRDLNIILQTVKVMVQRKGK